MYFYAIYIYVNIVPVKSTQAAWVSLMIVDVRAGLQFDLVTLEAGGVIKLCTHRVSNIILIIMIIVITDI